MSHMTIYGLGQVGLRIAALAAQRSFSVTGVDVDEALVNRINTNDIPLEDVSISPEGIERIDATTDSQSVIPETDVIIITVPTPIVRNYSVNLEILEAVFEDIGEYLSPGTTIIIESTIPPGTTKEIGQQTLEKYEHELDDDFYLAHCPERIDPGNDDWPLPDIPRVLGGASEESTDRALQIYERLLNVDIETVSDPMTAASAKIVENAYRDINIAFVNELARSLNSSAIDVDETLCAADTKPYGFTRFIPGPGVGGDCIPVDPYMLINTAKDAGRSADLLFRARNINDGMPEFVFRDIQDFLNDHHYPVNEAHILQLGASFKGGHGSEVQSPANDVVYKLKQRGAMVDTYDPYLPESSSVSSPYVQADVAVILTDHPEFEDLNLERIYSAGVELLYDARFVVDPSDAGKSSITFRRLGGKR